ncbi:MAG: heme-binding protein [Pseudomonadota bacterium]
MKKRMIIGGVIIAGLIAAAAWGPVVSNVPEARYTVTFKQDDFEIRDYAPMIVATVIVTGDRKTAIGDGFRLLADYIFGNNVAATKIEMTAPVIQQQQGQDIAMTKPVLQTETPDGKAWDVAFVMPAHYTLETLPKPVNDAVRIETRPARQFAVISFNGRATPDDLAAKTTALSGFVQAKNLKTIGEPSFAFYNPPMTLPFLRRNEVMVEITN